VIRLAPRPRGRATVVVRRPSTAALEPPPARFSFLFFSASTVITQFHHGQKEKEREQKKQKGANSVPGRSRYRCSPSCFLRSMSNIANLSSQPDRSAQSGATGQPASIPGIAPEIIAQLPVQAMEFAQNFPDVPLWKVLAEASQAQRSRFAAFVGSEPSIYSQHPMEDAIRLTATLPSALWDTLTSAINSLDRLTNFIAWADAPSQVTNFTASVFQIPSNSPVDWVLATAAHCCMVASYDVFEQKWQHRQLAMTAQVPHTAPPVPDSWTRRTGTALPAANQGTQGRYQRQPGVPTNDGNDPYRRGAYAQPGFANGSQAGPDQGGAYWGQPPSHDYTPPPPRFGFYNQNAYQQPPNLWETHKRRRQEPPLQASLPIDEGFISKVAYECSIPEATAKALAERKFVPAAEAFLGLVLTLGPAMKLQKEKPRMVSDDANGVNMSVGALMRAHAMFFPDAQGSNADHLKAMQSLVEVISLRGVWRIDTIVRQHGDTYDLPYFPPHHTLTYEILKAMHRFPRVSFSELTCANCGGDHGTEACRFKDVIIYKPSDAKLGKTNTGPTRRPTGDRGGGRGGRNGGGKGRGGNRDRTRDRNRNRGSSQTENQTPPPVPDLAVGACRDFSRGACNRGAVCRFSH
jgi:hypothetical protein